MTPKYEHNCSRCRFLGRIEYTAPVSGPIDADLYGCVSSDPETNRVFGPSLIARFDDEPGGYASMPEQMFKRAYLEDTSHTGISTAGPALFAAYALWLQVQGGRG